MNTSIFPYFVPVTKCVHDLRLTTNHIFWLKFLERKINIIMSMNNKSLLLLQQALLLADSSSDNEDSPDGTSSESSDDELTLLQLTQCISQLPQASHHYQPFLFYEEQNGHKSDVVSILFPLFIT